MIKQQDNKNNTVVVVWMNRRTDWQTERRINNILIGLLENIDFELFIEHHFVSIVRKQWQFKKQISRNKKSISDGRVVNFIFKMLTLSQFITFSTIFKM